MPIKVRLPTLHPGQVSAYRKKGRYKAIRCGRRWGKTALLSTIACDGAVKGENIGVFAPDYKLTTETFNDCVDILSPIRRSSSKVEGVIRTTTGGRIDFWTLDNERAGRSRKYHKVLIDEAAFGKENLMEIWERAIEPTLLDYLGSAIAFSNTNGVDQKNFFWRVCNEPKHGFVEFHAPTSTNPYMSASELAKLKERKHPLVFAQEYLAEFVDWSGESFFSKDKMLVNGEPVEYPQNCDQVFAVIDTAVKAGKEHDGTAVLFCAYSSYGAHPLILLDYDIVSIDGAMLEQWLPGILARLDVLAKKCSARYGSTGAWIEDAAAGSVLLQQCSLRGWNAQALPSELTAAGKDGRALNIGDAVYRGDVKFSRYCYEKNDVTFKEVTRNHLASQIFGFRIGDKDAAKRADDLTDCFTYAVAIALGNSEGFA